MPDLDGEEFGAFYQRTVRALWAYLARASGDRALADDLAQEAYLRLLRADFSGESEEHRRRYLFRTATNLLTDHRRRRRELPAPEPELEAGGYPGIYWAHEDRQGAPCRQQQRDLDPA